MIISIQRCRVAQWKRAGPITQRSKDQNLFLLEPFVNINYLHIPGISKLRSYLCMMINIQRSRVAQWKRAGPITQRSDDRNLALLIFFIFYENLMILHETPISPLEKFIKFFLPSTFLSDHCAYGLSCMYYNQIVLDLFSSLHKILTQGLIVSYRENKIVLIFTLQYLNN